MKGLWFSAAWIVLLLSGCGVKESFPTQPRATPTLKPENLKTIAWIGDSYAVDGKITGPFTNALQSRYGDGGTGWINLYYLCDVQPEVSIGAAGTWNIQRQTVTSTGLNISDVRTSDVSTPARLTVRVNADSATLFYYKQPGGGSFKWWSDDGVPIEIDTSASAPSIGSSTISGLTLALHLFQVQITSSNTAGIALDGMDVRSGNSGAVVHNLGSAGSDTEDWVRVDANLWGTQLAAVKPSLVLVMLSPNDQTERISVAKQTMNLTGLVGRVRAAVPEAPIVFIPPPDNGLNRLPTMSAYNAAQAELAKALGVGYIDVLNPMEPFDPADFGSDLPHPNEEGGAKVANLVLSGLSNLMH